VRVVRVSVPVAGAAFGRLDRRGRRRCGLDGGSDGNGGRGRGRLRGRGRRGGRSRGRDGRCHLGWLPGGSLLRALLPGGRCGPMRRCGRRPCDPDRGHRDAYDFQGRLSCDLRSGADARLSGRGRDDQGRDAETAARRERLDERSRRGRQRIGPQPRRPNHAGDDNQHRSKSARSHAHMIARAQDGRASAAPFSGASATTCVAPSFEALAPALAPPSRRSPRQPSRAAVEERLVEVGELRHEDRKPVFPGDH
jgi:hypothetical protein